jgi:hypothetical protein
MTTIEPSQQFIELKDMEKKLRDDRNVMKLITEYVMIQKKLTKSTHQYPFILTGISSINKIDSIDIGIDLCWDKNKNYLEVRTQMAYLNEDSDTWKQLMLYSKQHTRHEYFEFRFPDYKRDWDRIYTIEETLVLNVCVIDILNNLKWDTYSGGFIFTNDGCIQDSNPYYNIITINKCNELLGGLLTNDSIKSPHIDNECSVCFEKIGYNLKCGHRCCIECQQKLTKKSCPICRKKIREFYTDHNNDVFENDECDSDSDDDNE